MPTKRTTRKRAAKKKAPPQEHVMPSREVTPAEEEHAKTLKKHCQECGFETWRAPCERCGGGPVR